MPGTLNLNRQDSLPLAGDHRSVSWDASIREPVPRPHKRQQRRKRQSHRPPNRSHSQENSGFSEAEFACHAQFARIRPIVSHDVRGMYCLRLCLSGSNRTIRSGSSGNSVSGHFRRNGPLDAAHTTNLTLRSRLLLTDSFILWKKRRHGQEVHCRCRCRRSESADAS